MGRGRVGGCFLLVLAIGAGAAEDGAVADEGKTVSVYLHAPDDLLAITHGEQVAIGLYPAGIKSLNNTPVDSTLVLVGKVRDRDGNIIGITSELEYFPDLPLQADTPWDTYWTVVIPGRGSLFGYHRESLKKEIFDVFEAARNTEGGWRGNLTKRNTVGPLPGERGVVVGGTGEFADATGWFVEIGYLSGVSQQGELRARLELRFYLDGD